MQETATLLHFVPNIGEWNGPNAGLLLYFNPPHAELGDVGWLSTAAQSTRLHLGARSVTDGACPQHAVQAGGPHPIRTVPAPLCFELLPSWIHAHRPSRCSFWVTASPRLRAVAMGHQPFPASLLCKPCADTEPSASGAASSSRSELEDGLLWNKSVKLDT